MHGGTRKNAGRPALWDKRYSTRIMRLPIELRRALVEARSSKIPVRKIIAALKAA